MDDQFGGRTDDDLFADDFEPALSTEFAIKSDVAPQARSFALISPEKATVNAPAEPSALPTAPRGPKSLASSRHNTGNNSSNHSRKSSHRQRQTSDVGGRDTQMQGQSPSVPNKTHYQSADDAAAIAAAPETNKDDQEAAFAPVQLHQVGRKKAAAAAARLQSGANPRTKPTESELADKMERMKLVSAEKARRFEQAQRDETEHNLALAHGTEEARKRRLADEERRRRDAQNRRRMDEERAKNRERKLAAMTTAVAAKEGRRGAGSGKDGGGRDAGKQPDKKEKEEKEQMRSSFRGANHGASVAKKQQEGVKFAGGLHGSRFTAADDGKHEQPGKERSRGGRSRGRGGRGNFHENDGGRALITSGYPTKQSQQKRPPRAEEFIAPPASSAPHAETTRPGAGADLSLTPLVGKWDDEMAAMDDERK